MKRVFVVDDEPDVVELIETVLELEGYGVESETNGRQALARILKDPPDLVILDLMMPDLDGMELLKLLRAQPQGAGVPVVIVSARTGQLDQMGSLQLGANAYICKPFSNRELVAQVEQLIGLPDFGARDE
jgi:two-component system phosphate regulon response regulator PhoB/two-component system alkaline phosphatase synthesis response regulator PhoP